MSDFCKFLTLYKKIFMSGRGTYYIELVDGSGKFEWSSETSREFA